MSAKVQNVLHLAIVAGKAQPAPPLGPMLGANGVNIGAFTKEFNEKTGDYMKQFAGADVKVKCELTVYNDRTYKLELGGLVTTDLIKWKLGIKKGSGEPNKTKIGKISKVQLQEIAEIQKDSMNTKNPDAIISMVAASAESMGLEVEPGAVMYEKEVSFAA